MTDEVTEEAVASIFDITVVPNTIDLKEGQGDASFSAKNKTTRTLRAKAELVPEAPLDAGWLSLDQPEREFAPGGLQQFIVQVKVPQGSPAGRHNFRLDMTGVANPDEEYAAGPSVAFEVPKPPEPTKPKPFPWWIIAVVAAVLLVIGGVVAFLLLRNVDVPDVRGQAQPNAQATLEAGSLAVGTVTTRATGKDPDVVLEQTPEPLTPVARNSSVNLVVEAARVAAPGIVGRTPAAAQQTLADAGLRLGQQSERITGAQPGIILDQNPTAGTQVLSGSAVNVGVEAPRVAVPNIVGRTPAAAQQALAAVRLRLGQQSERFSGAQPGTVVDQAPAAGAQVLANSVVNVGVEAPRVAVPPVTGTFLPVAEDIIARAGLRVGRVTFVLSPVAFETVLDQDPNAGAQVVRGSAVNLTVARPLFIP